jgi:hypothetical protein
VVIVKKRRAVSRQGRQGYLYGEGPWDRCVGNGSAGCWDGKAAVTGAWRGRDRAPRTLFWKSKRRFRAAIGYPPWGMLDVLAPFRHTAAGLSMCAVCCC